MTEEETMSGLREMAQSIEMRCIMEGERVWIDPDNAQRTIDLLRTAAQRLENAADNYEGAMEDLNSVVTAFARRCKAASDWESALPYIVSNYPRQAAAVFGGRDKRIASSAVLAILEEYSEHVGREQLAELCANAALEAGPSKARPE